MLDPKFRIPRVMVGGLALGGVVAGCGSDAPSQAEVISDLCAAQEACDPVDFAEYYASQAECQTALAAEFEELVAENDAACRDALLAYYACVLPEYTATCANVETGCDAEIMAYERACY